MGRGNKLPSSQEEGANRDGRQNSRGGAKRQGGNKVDLGNFCCALFSHQPPSSYLLDNGTDGGGKRILYCHPSSESEHARGDGGCNGGGHIATGQGEERVACNDDPSPSSYSFVNDGGGKRVSYCHPSSRSERPRGKGGCIGGGHIATGQGEESVARGDVGWDSLFSNHPHHHTHLSMAMTEGERGYHIATHRCDRSTRGMTGAA